MSNYARYSFWMETAGEPLIPRPALARSDEVDVAILGGGYTGLWTAYYLLRENPNLKLAIVDKEIVGFGASGRNRGGCCSYCAVTAGLLEHRSGLKTSRSL
jgi:glycine/D-amino acid oxidase-like deaminating enzyme